MPQHNKASWLAVDWGTSRLRVWGMDDAGTVIDKYQSDKGAAHLESDMFEKCLIEIAKPLLDKSQITPALICGMAGARNRWCETPYLSVPCSPFDIGSQPQVVTTQTKILSPYILCGLSQQTPADVMRGEETQIVGVLSQMPNYNGTICLSGTHSKWVRVADGKVQDFRTVMSGEIYHLISTQSMLRRSISTDALDEDELLNAANCVVNALEKALAMLFSIRADSLLNNLPADVARGRLSGILLGAELAATKEYWVGDVILVGEQSLCEQYALILKSLSVNSTIFTAEEMTLAGLRHLYSIARENMV